MPRFVILEHDHPALHWDLMLEVGDVLQTWRLARAPERGRDIEATPLGGHRRMYLDYEGPVSGDRGTVKRWDAGEFTEESVSISTSRRLVFSGKIVCGNATLTKIDDTSWRFHWI